MLLYFTYLSRLVLRSKLLLSDVAVKQLQQQVIVRRLQTIEDIDDHLEFAIKRYHDNSQIRFAVDKVQTKVRLLH